VNVPRASAMLRMVSFAVAAGLALSGAQPIIAAAAGLVPAAWAAALSGPAIVVAALVFAVGRLLDRGDAVQPPWYSAWLILPGAFLLAGAAAMCIFGALVQLPLIPWTMWALLFGGSALWLAALALVRGYSR
jgi:hypothetical protein